MYVAFYVYVTFCVHVPFCVHVLCACDLVHQGLLREMEALNLIKAKPQPAKGGGAAASGPGRAPKEPDITHKRARYHP